MRDGQMARQLPCKITLDGDYEINLSPGSIPPPLRLITAVM